MLYEVITEIERHSCVPSSRPTRTKGLIFNSLLDHTAFGILEKFYEGLHFGALREFIAGYLYGIFSYNFV